MSHPGTGPPGEGKYVAAGPPPTDSIKLFVGQVPKNMSERDLLTIFKECGEVYELAVLRDKETSRHRGCAFVTYYSRDDATSAVIQFHDKRKLSPSVGFMQVKPASDCKIFVGNLPLDVTAEVVNSMFAKFGAVDEVHLIRDQRGEFKGCAFVRYRTKSDAVTAIQRLNDQKVNKGINSQLLVRFADGHRTAAQMVNGGAPIDAGESNGDTGNGDAPPLANGGGRGGDRAASFGSVVPVTRNLSQGSLDSAVKLDEQGLALANWLSNVIGSDARAYAQNFVQAGFRSINDIALLTDEDALRVGRVQVEQIVPNIVHRLRIVQAASMVLPPTVSADQLNNLKRWLEGTVHLDRSEADRSARRLAASGFLDLSDLMMLCNTTLCKSAGVDVSKILPNPAQRLKIVATIQLLQVPPSSSTQPPNVSNFGGVGTFGGADSEWQRGSSNPGLSSASSAWLPHN